MHFQHKRLVTWAWLIIFGMCLLPVAANAQAIEPSSSLIRKMVSVPDILEIRIAPDGKSVALVREEPDWQNNYYDNEIVLVDAGGERYLTRRTDGGSWRPRWQPKSSGIAYLQFRADSGTQLYFHGSIDSDPIALTDFEGGIRSYVWGPDGDSIALVISEPTDSVLERREKQLGEFRLADHHLGHRHIWLLNLSSVLASGQPATRASEGVGIRRLTRGEEFTVGGFWDAGNLTFTTDGSEILFDHSRNSSPDAVDTQDISAVSVLGGTIRPIIRRDGIDRNPIVSPDGSAFAFETSNGAHRYYGRDHLAIASITSGANKLITTNFPESAWLVAWSDDGIYFLASDRMDASLYLYDLQLDRIAKIADKQLDVAEADVSLDSAIAIAATSAERGPELYLSGNGKPFSKATDATSQFFPENETPIVSIVQSTASDGTLSTGVLYLPHDAEESVAPRPMLTIIHGGPKQTARPERAHAYVYPVEYWLRRGAAVFMPNYRGSAGFGDAYRSASYQNYGEGPMEDILAAIDILVEQGVANPERLGVMGWSNGGYLTSYIISQDNRFAAASVGAGITDWTMQYSLSDDLNGSVQYLGGTPSAEPEIYKFSSPISNVANIRTPVLIQHGLEDERVPIAQAQMLYRGLRSVGTPTEFVTFLGLTHYFSKPKARFAAAEQNRRWFGHYQFDEPAPNLELTDTTVISSVP